MDKISETVERAFSASRLAKAAIDAARQAADLCRRNPSDHTPVNAAYWLCRAAQDACDSAADALDPDWVQEHPAVFGAHQLVSLTSDEVCGAADDLVTAAAELGFKITK